MFHIYRNLLHNGASKFGDRRFNLYRMYRRNRTENVHTLNSYNITMTQLKRWQRMMAYYKHFKTLDRSLSLFTWNALSIDFFKNWIVLKQMVF